MSLKNATIGDENVAKFIKASAKSRKNLKGDFIIHQYKWRGEEIAIVSILFTIALALAGWAIYSDMNVGFFIASGVALALGIAVTNLGVGRKRKSRLTAIYSEATEELAVEGNGSDPAKNNGKLSEVKNASVKKIVRDSSGVDPKDMLLLTLEGDTNRHIQIPMRLVSRPELYEVLLETATRANKGKLDKRVAELFEAAKNYKG